MQSLIHEDRSHLAESVKKNNRVYSRTMSSKKGPKQNCITIIITLEGIEKMRIQKSENKTV